MQKKAKLVFRLELTQTGKSVVNFSAKASSLLPVAGTTPSPDEAAGLELDTKTDRLDHDFDLERSSGTTSTPASLLS
jgi:hypothetical protein